MSKHDDTYNKNFTRVPNIIFVSPKYAHLTNEELFLYCKLRSIYWDTKLHFQSLRDISAKTKYSIGALSKMLPRISDCGLVHAEIIQEYHPDGAKKGKPKYRISITDIWEENREYFEKCSSNEQYQDDNVHEMNNNVHEKVRQRSANEHKNASKGASQARSQLSKDNKDITKDSLKIESIGNEVSEVEPLAPNVALSSAFQSSLPQKETDFPIGDTATRNALSVEQESFMPIEKPKDSSKKKEKHTEPLVPKKVPEMPPAEMQWGTKKCLLMFDAWRGHVLIGTYKLSQASTCAKGLAEQYAEEEVKQVHKLMNESPYWQERGCADVCDVANNIHKEIRKVRLRLVKTSPQETEKRPSFLVSEEQKQKNIEKLRALAAAKAAKE